MAYANDSGIMAEPYVSLLEETDPEVTTTAEPSESSCCKRGNREYHHSGNCQRA